MLTVQQAFDLALQHHQAGRLSEAEALYRQILETQPNHTEAHNNLGLILAGWKRWEDAIAAHRRALRLQPFNPAIHHNLGISLVECGRVDEAVAAFRQAVQFHPSHARAWCNLGNALRIGGHFEDALAACRRTIELDPSIPEAHNNLGNALHEMGQLDAAVIAYRRALELNPHFAEVHSNLSNSLRELGQFDEATVASIRALALKPDLDLARFNYSMLLLLRDDYEQGWPLYEARWEANRVVKREFLRPQWTGQNVEGRSVLIHTEQGFGDSIQFIRYAPLVVKRGAKVIVECQRPLMNLFRSVEEIQEIIAIGDPLPPFDLHVPILSLPFIFKTTLQTIPRAGNYLFAERKQRDRWRVRCGNPRRLRVGIAWAGNTGKFSLRKRRIALEELLAILRVEGADFFSLQIGPGAEQLGSFSEAKLIVDHTEHIHNFADTAALMAELDLIISVDTAVAHLAGALGRPVWTLLPFVPDWRWGLEREDSPWYPTMRLFRQPALGDWDSVIQRVAGELERAVGEKRSQEKRP